MPDITYNDFSYLTPYKSFINRKDFWVDVIVQLNKDFGNESLIVIEPTINLEGDSVAESVVGKLQKVLPSVTPNLSEILYRIDISEQQAEALNDLPGDIYYRCLAEMLVKRIIIKVATRKMYSSQKK